MKKLLVVFAFISAISCNAQDFNRIDSLFARIDQHGKAMGSLSIFKNGVEVYYTGIGYANIETEQAINATTRFRIGSISKTFTAILIMQLIEEGKLSLDTRLDVFFSEIPNAAKITIEQLLRHRSGLYNFTNSEDYLDWMTRPKSRDELLKMVVNNGIVFEPGEKAAYSNTNYLVLSMIIEKITGKTYDEVLSEKIILPCHLRNTAYGAEIDTDNNEALSYEKLGSWKLAPETDMSIPLGAGGIVSTPYDLNKFMNCLFEGQLVSPKSLAAMRKIVDSYGIGLFEMPFYEHPALGHTGRIDGFQSVAYLFPDDRVAVSYCTNAVDMSRNDILKGVLSIYFGSAYTLPTFSEALQLNVDLLKQYLGTYGAPDFPLKITFTLDGNVLIAQGIGQPSFPLEAYETNKFKFDRAGLSLEFVPDSAQVIIHQHGNAWTLKKE